MYLATTPIPHFFKRSVVASIAREYTALLIIVARTADGETLQDQLLDNWDSFDDLTAEDILVICAGAKASSCQAWVPHSSDPSALVYDGLAFTHQPKPEWNEVFWGHYAPSLPYPKAALRSSITAAATETARYFGIPERLLPCVLILSLRDQAAFIVPSASLMSLYEFTRSILVEFEPSLTKILTLRYELGLATAVLEAAELDADLKMADLRGTRSKLANLTADYEAQLSSLRDHLLQVSYPLVSDEAKWLAESIGGEPPIDLFDRSARFLSVLEAEAQCARVPDYLYWRLVSKLPRAVDKILRHGNNKQFWEDLEKLNKLDDEGNLLIEKSARRVEDLQVRVDELTRTLEEARASSRFSSALLRAASSRGLKAVGFSAARHSELTKWKTAVLQNDDSREHRFVL